MASLASLKASPAALIKASPAPFTTSRPRLPARHKSLHVAAAAGGKPDEKVKKQGPVSGAYKERLRDEYVGFGGAPNKPMGSNYFLWIIGIISVLALAAFLTGSV